MSVKGSVADAKFVTHLISMSSQDDPNRPSRRASLGADAWSAYDCRVGEGRGINGPVPEFQDDELWRWHPSGAERERSWLC